MAGTTPRLDFAVIGHQENWKDIEIFINRLRKPEQDILSIDKINYFFPFIPPRVLFNVNVKSVWGKEIRGVYIETFIDPDKLDNSHGKTNLKKVLQAAICAQKANAGIATFGGFTSIFQEGNLNFIPPGPTKFTTGNTLTVAYIIKAVEAASKYCNINISRSNVLILGATGDIGQACVNYFKDKAEAILLCARNKHRLQSVSAGLKNEGFNSILDTSPEKLLPIADVIICVASAFELNLSGFKKNVLICDAGYPKNLQYQINDNRDVHLFYGGMGQVKSGFSFDPDYSGSIYKYPAPGVAHGCILEAMALAFEKKIESYSVGKGNITQTKIEEIYQMAGKYGITTAPLFNINGLWPLQKF